MQSMRVDVLARLEFVFCAAIGAFGVAVLAHIEKDARMAAPHLHAGLFAGAENTALGIQVFRAEFNRLLHQFIPWSANGRI